MRPCLNNFLKKWCFIYSISVNLLPRHSWFTDSMWITCLWSNSQLMFKLKFKAAKSIFFHSQAVVTIWSHVNRKDVSKYCSAQPYVCVCAYIYIGLQRETDICWLWTYFHLSYFWRTASLHRKHYCRWQETKYWKQRVFSLGTEVYTAMYTETFNCHSEQ